MPKKSTRQKHPAPPPTCVAEGCEKQSVVHTGFENAMLCKDCGVKFDAIISDMAHSSGGKDFDSRQSSDEFRQEWTDYVPPMPTWGDVTGAASGAYNVTANKARDVRNIYTGEHDTSRLHAGAKAMGHMADYAGQYLGKGTVDMTGRAVEGAVDLGIATAGKFGKYAGMAGTALSGAGPALASLAGGSVALPALAATALAGGGYLAYKKWKKNRDEAALFNKGRDRSSRKSSHHRHDHDDDDWDDHYHRSRSQDSRRHRGSRSHSRSRSRSRDRQNTDYDVEDIQQKLAMLKAYQEGQEVSGLPQMLRGGVQQGMQSLPPQFPTVSPIGRIDSPPPGGMYVEPRMQGGPMQYGGMQPSPLSQPPYGMQMQPQPMIPTTMPHNMTNVYDVKPFSRRQHSVALPEDSGPTYELGQRVKARCPLKGQQGVERCTTVLKSSVPSVDVQVGDMGMLCNINPPQIRWDKNPEICYALPQKIDHNGSMFPTWKRTRCQARLESGERCPLSATHTVMSGSATEEFSKKLSSVLKDSGGAGVPFRAPSAEKKECCNWCKTHYEQLKNVLVSHDRKEGNVGFFRKGLDAVLTNSAISKELDSITIAWEFYDPWRITRLWGALRGKDYSAGHQSKQLKQLGGSPTTRHMEEADVAQLRTQIPPGMENDATLKALMWFASSAPQSVLRSQVISQLRGRIQQVTQMPGVPDHPTIESLAKQYMDATEDSHKMMLMTSLVAQREQLGPSTPGSFAGGSPPWGSQWGSPTQMPPMAATSPNMLVPVHNPYSGTSSPQTSHRGGTLALGAYSPGVSTTPQSFGSVGSMSSPGASVWGNVPTLGGSQGVHWASMRSMDSMRADRRSEEMAKKFENFIATQRQKGSFSQEYLGNYLGDHVGENTAIHTDDEDDDTAFLQQAIKSGIVELNSMGVDVSKLYEIYVKQVGTTNLTAEDFPRFVERFVGATLDCDDPRPTSIHDSGKPPKEFGETSGTIVPLRPDSSWTPVSVADAIDIYRKFHLCVMMLAANLHPSNVCMTTWLPLKKDENGIQIDQSGITFHSFRQTVTMCTKNNVRYLFASIRCGNCSTSLGGDSVLYDGYLLMDIVDSTVELFPTLESGMGELSKISAMVSNQLLPEIEKITGVVFVNVTQRGEACASSEDVLSAVGLRTPAELCRVMACYYTMVRIMQPMFAASFVWRTVRDIMETTEGARNFIQYCNQVIVSQGIQDAVCIGLMGQKSSAAMIREVDPAEGDVFYDFLYKSTDYLNAGKYGDLLQFLQDMPLYASTSAVERFSNARELATETKRRLALVGSRRNQHLKYPIRSEIQTRLDSASSQWSEAAERASGDLVLGKTLAQRARMLPTKGP
jgi:hypothetical protein